jgi:transcriptional regulator with XRE-family HTH domain
MNLSAAHVREILRKGCKAKTQKGYARELGVSVSYLNRTIKGRRVEPGPKLLKALGLRRVLVYVPTK